MNVTHRKISLLKNKWTRFIGAIALFIILALFLLPVAGKYYLTKWLLENGADAVTIEKIRINPFTGTASLVGVDIRQNGKPVFSNSTIFINLGLRALFNKEGRLDKVLLENMVIDVELSNDGRLRIGSYTIVPSPAETEPASSITPNGLPWIFKAMDVVIKQTIVHYQQPDLQVKLVIDQAELIKFNTDPDDHTGTLNFTGSINGAPVNFNFTKLHVIPELAIEGDIQINDFQLQDLEQLLQEWLLPFTGTVTTAGEIHFSMDFQDNMQAGFNGSLQIAGADIAGKGWGSEGDALSWNGKVAFSDTETKGMRIDIDGKLKGEQIAYDMPNRSLHIFCPQVLIDGKTTVAISNRVSVDTYADMQLAGSDFQLSPLQVQDHGINWKGTIVYRQGADAKAPSSISTDGILTSTGLTVNLDQQLDFTQQHAELHGKTDVVLAGDIHINYDGKLSFKDNQLAMEELSVGAGSLLWLGQAGYVLAEDRHQEVKLQGTIQGEQIKTELVAANLDFAQENVSASADCALTLAQRPSFTGTAGLEANQFVLKVDSQPMLTLKQGNIVEIAGNGTGGLSIENVTLEELTVLNTEKQPIKVEIPTITLTDVVSSDLHTATISLLEIKQPQVDNMKENSLLAAIDQISARTIAVDQQARFTVDDLQLKDGRFLASKKQQNPMATLSSAKAGQISWAGDEGLFCNTIAIDGIYAYINKENNAARKGVEKKAAPGEKEKNTPPKIKINHVAVSGKSGFRYTDPNLKPAFEALFALESLKIKNIDSSKQDQPLSYQLAGKFNKHAPLAVNGTASPFAERLQVNQELILRNVQAQNISPYSIAAIGYLFESGQLRLTSKLAVNGEVVDMKNTIKIEGLQTKAVDKKLAKELNNQLPIPLDTALYLLRDRNGDIEIEVPIQGKISDIHVGISDILITALTTAITDTVTPYLAYSFLGPGGAIAYLGVQAGQALIDTSFPKLEFEPGVSVLNQEQQATLDSIGKNIQTTENDYSICAKVSVWEGTENIENSPENQQKLLEDEIVRKKLFALGEERAINVKNYLVSSAHINADRLLICNPGINFDKNSKSTVELKK